MNRLAVVTVTLLAVVSPALADDKAAADPAARQKAELKARAEKLLSAGTTGAFPNDEKDFKDGRCVRVFVVGTATISTVLGVAEGLEIAREKAEENAKAAFVKWLGSKVSVRRTSGDEVLLLKEGDGAGVKDQQKTLDRTTKAYEETAAGLIRGLKVVAYEQKGAERKVIVVYRWDAEPDPAAAKNRTATKPGDSVIPDKKVIIDDAP